MEGPPNVELEAAKFLQKLIQESKDEPTKLATKLHVILKHMRSSGKENSMPYQVISRAMETVINQHGLDIDVLMSSRVPLATETQVVESASSQFGGSSLRGDVKEANTGLLSRESAKADSYVSNKPPVGPSSAGHDIYLGSVSHLNSKSLDHESPSSFDTRSAKSQSEDSPKWEKARKKDNNKGGSKRKRADPSSNTESLLGNIQPLESSTFSSGMDKAATNINQSRSISIHGGEHGQFNNMIQSSSTMEHNAMRSALRAKQEIQHQAEMSLDSTNISNSLSRTPHSRHPEEIEVSSAHDAISRQQGVSHPIAHDVLNSRGLWNQNIVGLPFEKAQVSRFSPLASGGNSSADTSMHQPACTTGKVYGMASGTSGPYAAAVPGLPGPAQFSNTYDNPNLGPKMHKDRNIEPFSSASSLELPSDKGAFGKALEYGGGILHTSGIDNSTIQGSMLNNTADMAVFRSTGRLPVSQSPSASIMPFKEQHLKQLRAQCLVYLAFRNGLKPKKLHLDFALGNFLPKEEGPSKEMIDQKGKEQLTDGTSSTPDVLTPFGRLDKSRESESFCLDPSSVGMFANVKLTKEGECMNMAADKNGVTSGLNEYGEEIRHIMMTSRNSDTEMQTGEIAQSQLSEKGAEPGGDFTLRGSAHNNLKDDLDNRLQPVRSIEQASAVMGGQQVKAEVTGRTGKGCGEEASSLSVPSSTVLNETMPERNDNAPSRSFSLAGRNFQGSRPADAYFPSFPSREHWKPLSRGDGGNHLGSQDDMKISHKSFSSSDGSKMVPVDNALLDGNPFTVGETVHEEEDISVATDSSPPPKSTTTEKWIIDQQKRKLLTEKTWALKQQRTQQRITACSDKLKDNVGSSEDISAKTRSVIELKKLQLLELQSRLRNDILSDFFKPIASDMDRLKSIKKHRIGRRSKQLEKYEQKMKEERQRRFRERQKEFFSEIEVHKERLEDLFKMRRERWKGFNRAVREFHKRKERVQREKIDRIQREKINLLKINDVEGYLRMVQDAKSDRVKQLLKETEKYLQKLGSKLRDAKAMSRCSETDMDDTRSAGVMEKNEMTIDNEDEADQAKHYLESNEKYYLMAHSIKENVAEQPSFLVGGKLREYQMNGLRWLVSLYNNHLNGILADEMGLGKTVQVISLICYLMEYKNDRGPFLVVVPSSVLPGWDSEINFWAPSINKIVYSGPPEERRKLFKERIVPQKFNVLLTTYEYLMNKHDRPKLSKIHWHYVIIDEGHRIKNASCKLNADLKLYHSSHRLLLTGTPLQNNLEELWALLNFLLPNIFNSSEDFSQWFNKPFESSGDSSPDEALLSEEENLLIINRLHQVLRPFVLRRLKHKVENELPEKIERLVRCEASAYQKLLMKRVEDNLGALGTSKARSVHNSVMELRNICNHPYLSQLHSEQVHDYIPKHYLPNVVRLCGKLEMLDRILPKLKATGHRVLLFSTMTRLLDVMEDYLYWKQYKYLRLDGHTSGGDRGALINQYNKPDSPYFIFLLSIRAGGVGVNLQAADTVIIFDTDWNPQVDLQAQARAHRIGQKREVLVLRFETVQTVEEQVRAAAEHKLGVANQSITAGFFDNNTSAEDRREYLESLLRECKKEEAAPVLHDDAVNDLIARSESEIDIFEAIDKRRQDEEMAAWKSALGEGTNSSEPELTLPSRLLTAEDLKPFCEAMKIYDAPTSVVVSSVGMKRKSGYLGGLDTQHYGRGKRAREVRSYEEQWTEDEFEKLCQAESPHSPRMKDEVNEMNSPMVPSVNFNIDVKAETMAPLEQPTQPPLAQSAQPPLVQPVQPPLVQPVQLPFVYAAQPLVPHLTQSEDPIQHTAYPSVPQAGNPPFMQPTQQSKEITPKRGRGRPKRATTQISPSKMVVPELSGAGNMNAGSQIGAVSNASTEPGLDSIPSSTVVGVLVTPSSQAIAIPPFASPSSQPTPESSSVPVPDKRRGRKNLSGGETPKRRGRKPSVVSSTTLVLSPSPGTDNSALVSREQTVSTLPPAPVCAKNSVVHHAKGFDKEASSLSLVPSLLPSSDTIKQQDAAVSISPVLSDPSVITGTSVTVKELHAGTTDSQQILPFHSLPPDSQLASVGTDISSQQNLQFSSVSYVPQSVPPSQVVPKQVKGRERKAQNEGVTPRRRGRKPNAASAAVPSGSGGQELTSTEPPQKKSRVSSGRATVATRRTQQNETQLDVPVSGDSILLTKVEACQSILHPAANEICNAAVKDVAPSIEEVSEDTLSEFQSPSESLPVTNLAIPALGTAPVSDIGICDVQTKQEGGGKLDEITSASVCKLVSQNSQMNVSESKTNAADIASSATSAKQLTYLKIGADCGIGGATLSDTLTDISENHNLEDRKFSALSNLETSTATQSSGNMSNLASPSLGTGQVVDVVKVRSSSEKGSGEKPEEVKNALSDGSLVPVPKVHKSECKVADVFVQNVAEPDTNKFTEESLRDKDAGQYVSGKSVDTKDSAGNITRKAVSYAEGRVVEVDDAMVETRESVNIYEVSAAVDGTEQDLVGSSGAGKMSEIIVGMTNVAAGDADGSAGDADGSAGLIGENFIDPKDVTLNDLNSSKECAGEKLDGTADALVAREDNTEKSAATKKSGIQYEAKHFSDLKADRVSTHTSKLAHDWADTESITKTQETKLSEEIEVFKGEPEHKIIEPSESQSREHGGQTFLTIEETVDGQTQNEFLAKHSQTQTVEGKLIENMEVVKETIRYERIEQQGGQILHDSGTLAETEQKTEEINVEQYQSQTEASRDEKIHVLDAHEPDSSEHKKGGEILAETGHTEEHLDKQFQIGDRVNSSEKVRSFQEATAHDKREHENRVPLAGAVSAVEIEQTSESLSARSCESQTNKDSDTLKEPPIEQCKFQTSEVSEPQKNDEEVLHTEADVTVRIGLGFEEPPSEQCLTCAKEDSEPSESVEVLHVGAETTTKTVQRLEELSRELRQTRGADSEPSEMSKEVPGETTCDRMEQGDGVIHDNVEVTVEVEQSLEEPSVQQCQTQMEKDFEASEKVEFASDQNQTQAKEDMEPKEMSKEVAGETICDRMEEGDRVVHDNVEVTVKVEPSLEEPSVQHCPTQMEKDFEASENLTRAGEDLELSKMSKEVPGETTCDRMEQGDGVILDNAEVTIEVGQSLIEPSVQQCQSQSEKDVKISDKVVLSTEQHETRAEEVSELPGKKCGSQVEEAKLSEERKEVPLEENAHDASLLQDNRVLLGDSQTSVQIGQKSEILHTEQYQTQGSENFEPSDKAEILPKATEPERREELGAGKFLDATEETADIIGRKNEVVGQSQPQVVVEVEAFMGPSEHEKIEQGGAASHALAQNSTEMRHTECQTEENKAGRLGEVEEVTQNECMDSPTNLIVDSGGKNVAKMHEMGNDVQSCTGAVERHEGLPPEHATE